MIWDAVAAAQKQQTSPHRSARKLSSKKTKLFLRNHSDKHIEQLYSFVK